METREEIEALKKRVAVLENQIQEQPKAKKKIMGFVDGKLVNYSA